MALPGSTWKKGWVIQVLILPLSKILNRPKFDELWEFHKQNQLSWGFFTIAVTRVTHQAPQNDRLNLSFVKDDHVVGKKIARYGLKMTIYQFLFFGSSPNLQRASGYIWGHSFWSNRDLDPSSTSNWPSEPQICERCTRRWWKNGQKRSYKGHL